MDIKVYEVICCKGSKLGDILDRALNELKMEDSYAVISDIQSILNKGILSPPALEIDGKVYISGRLPSMEQVRDALIKAKNTH